MYVCTCNIRTSLCCNGICAQIHTFVSLLPRYYNTWIWLHAHVFINLYIPAWASACVFISMHICVRVHQGLPMPLQVLHVIAIFGLRCAQTYLRWSVCIYVCIHACTCACIYIYTYIHIYIYIYIKFPCADSYMTHHPVSMSLNAHALACSNLES